MGVYKKKDRWYIDYYLLPSRKRKREVVTIPGVDPAQINREDAKKALSIRKAELAQGKFDILQTEKALPFKSLLKDYLEWAKDNHKSYDRDISATKQLLKFFENIKINNLTSWHISRYKSERKSLDIKPETINKELSILRRMLNLAVEWKKISQNPIKKMDLEKVPKSNPRLIKDWEFNLLYKNAVEHFKPILLCAYMTGMRRGEIAKLKWSDVDLEQRCIYVNETKNDDCRSIPINESLYQILVNLKNSASSIYVFTAREGKPYTGKNVWRTAWDNAFKKAGIDYCTFHHLRHTFTSRLIVDEKEDYATVMALTGHKDIRMLQRYSHTREEAKRSAVNKISGLNYL